MIAVGALLTSAAMHRHQLPELVMGVFTLLIGTVLVLIIAPLRYRQILTSVHAAASPMARRTCQLLAAVIVGVAVLGASLAVRGIVL